MGYANLIARVSLALRLDHGQIWKGGMRDHLSRDDLDADVLSRLAESDSAPDANNRTTISGFDPAEDVLLIAVPAGQDASITGQTHTRAGLVVTFSTGESVLLEGLDVPIDDAAVTFVEEADDTPQAPPEDATAGTPETSPDTSPEASPQPKPEPEPAPNSGPESAPESGLESGPVTTAATAPSGVLYFGSYTSGDGQPHDYMGTRDVPAHPPTATDDVSGNVTLTGFAAGTDCIAISSDAPEALSVTAQNITAQGLHITLSNGVTVTLPGVDTALEQADVVFVATGVTLP